MMFRRLMPFADCRNTPLRWIAIAVALCAAISSATHASAQALAQMDHVSIATMGKGSPVVLIPGLSSPRETWEKQAPELAKTHTLYLVQLNGFGAKEDPRANLQPGALDGAVAEIDRFLAEHKAAHVPVIGHSMGGLVALMLAKQHPADVGKLMIVDALPWIGTLFGAQNVAAIEPQGRALRDQLAATYGKTVPGSGQSAAMRNALTPEARARVAAWSEAADPRVVAETMYEDMITDLRGDVAAIHAPITVIFPDDKSGEASKIYAAAYASAPIKPMLVPVMDSQHFVMLDQPALFLAEVQKFLSR